MVALVTIIQAALEWAVFRAGLFGEDPAAAALIRPLTLAWFIAIGAAGIGSASAADLGYQQYLHNLDAANAVTEQNVDQTAVTANSNADFYNR